MAAMFVDIRRCGLCRKATKDGHILEAGDMVNLDACCVSGGDKLSYSDIKSNIEGEL
jgi:hypothetical protein